jgi:hypothetical protein
MVTTPEMSRTARNRNRESDRGADGEAARETYELLAATVVGVLAGAGIALLVRQSRGKRRRVDRALDRLPSPRGRRRGGRRDRHAAERAATLLGRLPLEGVGEALGAQLAAARAAIDEVVAEEVKDLRKAIRQQRKRLGV